MASSPEKLAVAGDHGATHLIDHRPSDLRPALRELLPDGADVVVDPVGGDLSEPALRSLRWGGRFVTVGYASGAIPRIPLNLVLLKGIRVLGFEFLDFVAHAARRRSSATRRSWSLCWPTAAPLPHIGAIVRPRRRRRRPALVADGRAIGKVVLDVAPASR